MRRCRCKGGGQRRRGQRWHRRRGRDGVRRGGDIIGGGAETALEEQEGLRRQDWRRLRWWHGWWREPRLSYRRGGMGERRSAQVSMQFSASDGR
ncbi:hypothetical protein NL676_033625 [Syzygium grande]|nr:hypothetical protein NL676_033625 [Syzygium grande]